MDAERFVFIMYFLARKGQIVIVFIRMVVPKCVGYGLQQSRFVDFLVVAWIVVELLTEATFGIGGD